MTSHQLASWLHDYPAQVIAAARLRLYRVRQQTDQPDFVDELAQIESLLDQAGKQLREAMHGSMQVCFNDLPVEEALRRAADEAKALYGIDCQCDCQAGIKLTADQNELFARCLREGLINAAKHAGAKSADVALRIKASHVVLTLSHTSPQLQSDLAPRSHDDSFGISLIKESAMRLGGSLELEISPSGDEATQLICSLPFSNQAD